MRNVFRDKSQQFPTCQQQYVTLLSFQTIQGTEYVLGNIQCDYFGMEGALHWIPEVTCSCVASCFLQCTSWEIGPTKIGSSHHDHGSCGVLFIKGMNHTAYGSMGARQKEDLVPWVNSLLSWFVVRSNDRCNRPEYAVTIESPLKEALPGHTPPRTVQRTR